MHPNSDAYRADLLSEAARACERAPAGTADARMLRVLGTIASGKRQHRFAERCFARAVDREPDSVVSLRAWAGALEALGRYDEAIEAWRRAVVAAPGELEGYRGLGLALAHERRWDEAVSAFGEAVRREPARGDVQQDLGDVLRAMGRVDAAVDAYRSAFALDPRDPAVHRRLGDAARERGQLGEAIDWFQRGLTVASAQTVPRLVELHTGLGESLLASGDAAGAVQAFKEALQGDPYHLRASQMLVCALEMQNRLAEAVGAWCALGYALIHRRRFPESLAAFARARAIKPDCLTAIVTEGHAYAALDEPERAAAAFSRALAIDDGQRDTHFALGQALLEIGEFEQGWREYAFHQKDRRESDRRAEQPEWTGDSLAGRTIMLWCDWGLGDTVQFVRYARAMKADGARVVVECPRALVSLLRSQPYIDEVAVEAGPRPPFDVHAAMPSLPRISRTTRSSIPSDVPYLSVDDALMAEWRGMLGHGEGSPLKVGMVWAGGADRHDARERFVSFADYEAFMDLPGIRFISLQQGPARAELLAASDDVRVEAFDTQARSLADAAALISQLDVVISVDTMVAHLAGALARPVWLLIPYAGEWRWGRTDSTPWYPTMRIFRQRVMGDWPGVMADVRAALVQLLSERRASSSSTASSSAAEPRSLESGEAVR